MPIAEAPLVSFADGESKQVIVVQQSFASTENASGVAAACLQHGIRVQKPMIADAGARPAMSRTIARLIRTT